MVTLTKENAIKAVRKNLDEQDWNPSQMYDESEDNSELDRIIERTIPEAIDVVNLAAPVAALEATESSFVEEGVNDSVLSFRTEKPVLRFVSMRAADSEVVIADAVPEVSPEGRKQLNRFVRGTSDNPTLVLQSGTRNHFKYYTVGDQKVNRPRKVADYFYEINLDTIDYDFARDYFAHRDPEANIGHCSAVKYGGFFGSNYDWHYNDGASALIRTKAAEGRHAVMGMAGGLSGFTKAFAESGADSDIYKILPFYLIDGCNDAGVFAKIQVVNKVWDKHTTVPAVSEEDRICTLMLVRYILDNFSTAGEAVNYIHDHVALFSPDALHDMGYEVHFFVGDKNNPDQYVIELVDGDTVVLDDYSALTNFYMDGVELGTNNLVTTQQDIVDYGHYPTIDNNLTLYSTGLERWNLITQAYHANFTKADMRELMNELLFTNAYKDATDPFWYSEFAGPDTYNVDTPTDDAGLKRVVAVAKANCEGRNRSNPITWHTVHSCVYDLATNRVYVVAQEDTANEYSFGFNDLVPETHIQQLSYIPFARKADSYEVGTGLLTAVIDQLTAMVLAIYGENDKAKYFFEKANIQ